MTARYVRKRGTSAAAVAERQARSGIRLEVVIGAPTAATREQREAGLRALADLILDHLAGQPA